MYYNRHFSVCLIFSWCAGNRRISFAESFHFMSCLIRTHLAQCILPGSHVLLCCWLTHVLRKQALNSGCVVLLVTDWCWHFWYCPYSEFDELYAVGHLHTNHALGHAVDHTSHMMLNILWLLLVSRNDPEADNRDEKWSCLVWFWYSGTILNCSAAPIAFTLYRLRHWSRVIA